jgi:hypothetical protein
MNVNDKVAYLGFYADVVSVDGESVWIKYVIGEQTVTKKVSKWELIKVGNGSFRI